MVESLECMFTYRPIGIIHTPFTDISGMPIQPSGARGVKGSIVLNHEFKEGLADIDGFTRLILIYALHKCQGSALVVNPFLDPTPRGVFATRSPRRPNAIGLSVVKLVGVTDNKLSIEDVDMLDGTPLLDIKPYVPDFDAYTNERIGWLSRVAENAKHTRSDDRFR